MKTGHLRFSHLEGGHDDALRAIALIVCAAIEASLLEVGAFLSH